jgi:AhpD family alkylhydroperoxidase
MAERMKFSKAFPEGVHALLSLGTVIEGSGLEPALMELVKVRASQMNACAFCIDMHTKNARALGESEMRLYALDAWRETPFFTMRERAALAWTEVVTNIQHGHASDEEYQAARREFGEGELARLTMVIGQINLWNRVQIAFRAEPGIYKATKAGN